LITGYDWDFGNGSVDRSTMGPTTSFAYASAGTFTPKVAAPPKITLARSGKKGS
jgi:PKD repeat protein